MLTWGKVDQQFLEVQFLNDVHDLLHKSPFDWYVTEGYRTMERSNKLYDEYINGIVIGRAADGTSIRGKKGPRAAPGGKSAHNYGLAIDVALDGDANKPGLQPTWDVSVKGWAWLKYSVGMHPRLRSGWRYNDWPHIERLNWSNYVGWKKNYDDNRRAISDPSNYIGIGIPAT